MVRLKEEIAKKTATNEEKSALSPRQCTVSQVDRKDSKTTCSDYWQFAHLKRMLKGKRIGSDEEVILETEA